MLDFFIFCDDGDGEYVNHKKKKSRPIKDRGEIYLQKPQHFVEH